MVIADSGGLTPAGVRADAVRRRRREPTTRQRMIDVAERLFAERGIDAVPLSTIVTESGQRNRSAAQYHFESKDGLVQAILEARKDTNEDIRSEFVARLTARGGPYTLDEVLRVWVEPLVLGIVGAKDGSWYLRFISRVFVRNPDYLDRPGPGWVPTGAVLTGTPSINWMYLQLRRALPDLDDESFRRRVRWAMSGTLHVLSDYEESWLHDDGLTPQQVIMDVTAMCRGVLQAPWVVD